MMAGVYYGEEDYKNALDYYKKGREYADDYEYKYQLDYKIANCYNYLKDTQNAKQWYKTFLDENWEPERIAECVRYAKEYVEYTDDKPSAEETNKAAVTETATKKQTLSTDDE